MKLRRHPALLALTLLAVVALLGTAGRAAWRIKQSAELARESEPFQAKPAQPLARLLVVGDSTGVGTGATAPAFSLVGLISKDHPGWEVVNRAKDGARFADIVGQLEAIGNQRFDAVLVLGGGNDVIRFTGHAALAQDVARTAQVARMRSSLVVLMPSGNLGNAPFFFAPLSWLMSRRSRELHQLVRQAAADHDALYVNLYKPKAQDPFAQRPDLNAGDGLHPSDAGYRVWYDELKEQADFSNRMQSRAR